MSLQCRVMQSVRGIGLGLWLPSALRLTTWKFPIVWNATRRTFDIERDGKPTGGFAKDKQTAVGLACRAAQFENREGKTVVVYSTNSDGKTIVEWSG